MNVNGKEYPLVAKEGTPAGHHDITPPSTERIPDAPPEFRKVQEGGGTEADQGEGWWVRPM